MNNKKVTQFLTMTVFIFVFAVITFMYLFVFDSNIGVFSSGFFANIAKPSKNNNQKFNVLVMGVDDTSQCTDTMFVVNINTTDMVVNSIMIPRDTKIKIKGKNSKINAAYAYGDGKLAMESVSQLLKIPVESYVLFDTEAFRETIDILDGVYINVAQDMNYYDPIQNLNIRLKKGYQLLDGKKSEQYIRYRSGYSNGDIGRLEVQKQFLKQLIEQKLSFKYISKIDDILGIVYKHIKTNINVTDALKYAHILSKIDISNINFFTLPGTAVEEETWYYIPDYKSTDKIIANFT